MKKIVLVFLVILSFSKLSFSQFEATIKVPFSLSAIYVEPSGSYYVPPSIGNLASIENTIGTSDTLKQALSFSIGGLLEVGYSFDLGNEKGLTSISLLADIGYNMQPFGAYYYKDYVKHEDMFFFNTINVGLLHKFNLNLDPPFAYAPFSIGLGYGVKIPLSAERVTGVYSQDGYDDYNKSSLSYSDIKTMFNNNHIIAYVKVVFDVYYYMTEHTGLVLSIWYGYNFGLSYTTLNPDADMNNFVNTPLESTDLLRKNSFSSIDIGASVGYYFGKENPKD